MPQAIPAIIQYAVNFIVYAAGGSSAAASAIGSAVVLAVETVAVASVARMLTPKPNFGSITSSVSGGATVNVRDPAASHRIIYGQRMVAGIVYPLGVSGTNNDYLHLAVILTCHEVQELGSVYFDDVEIPLDGSGNATGTFAGYVRVKKLLGTYNQTVDTDTQTDLTSGVWSNNHKFRGRAVLIIRLKYSPDLFPSQVPNITCLVKGRKVYDWRDGAQSPTDPTTWVWSANSALCLADYLRGVPMKNYAGTIIRPYGMKATDAELSSSDITEAANICDETVVTDGPSTESRYTTNGLIDVGARRADVITALASAMAGDCVNIGGSWVIRAGAYLTPAITLTTDDLRAPLTEIDTAPSARDLCNGVRGTYFSALNQYQPADFPAVTNATYMTQDGSERHWRDIELPFTNSGSMAQRLAKITMEDSRQAISFIFPGKLSCLRCQVTDNVGFTFDKLGWTAKVFRVVGFTFVPDTDSEGNVVYGCDLNLKETASGVYDWADGEETTVDLAVNTTLPDPRSVPTPSAPTLASGSTNAFLQPDGTTVPRMKVSWTAPANILVTAGGFVAIEYKQTSSGTWIPWGRVRGDATEDYITDVKQGISYDVRIRFENRLVRGAFSSTSTHTITGDSSAPATPTSLTATAGTGKAVSLDWDDNTEPDFSEYKVFKNTVNNSATATEIAEVRASRFVDIDVTIGTTYYYWLKAIDRSENASGFSTGASATPGTVPGTLDTTPPSTPSAPSVSSSATYQSGSDGTVFARVAVTMPAMPSGGELLNLYYRKDGSSGWLIADQTDTGGSTSTLDDLTPGVDYEMACAAISSFGVLSAFSTAVDFTAANLSSASANATSITPHALSSSYTAAPKYYFGFMAYAAVVTFTRSTAKDVLRYEFGRHTAGTGDPASVLGTVGPDEDQFPYYAYDLLGQFLCMRSVNRSGIASAWTNTGYNMNAYIGYGAGDLSLQNSDDAEMSGVKVGSLSASSVLKMEAFYKASEVPTLAGGSTTENFNVDLTNRGFSTKPDVGVIQCSSDSNLVAAYDWDDAGNSSTNAVVRVKAISGNIAAGAARFSCEFTAFN